jgi:hypothetical protein
MQTKAGSGEAALPKEGGVRPQAQNPAAVALLARFNQAVALHQQGQLVEAERIYEEVLLRQPNPESTWPLLNRP